MLTLSYLSSCAHSLVLTLSHLFSCHAPSFMPSYFLMSLGIETIDCGTTTSACHVTCVFAHSQPPPFTTSTMAQTLAGGALDRIFLQQFWTLTSNVKTRWTEMKVTSGKARFEAVISHI
ncbi:uncharacterized protein HD556DRAFT_1400549 [Suillus plorans]|uniref:Secreted protein n=1 Tax=Suillus plorans TaxID=116603 RepID=A0A9P7AGY0_9AGAM|nr:uncharacterized protein HD556DRAFT_1400549 [Suillus plorans]KAG1789086.1 hypothetical protein HD556DRAFT_1400549 [Suillus plorans]